MINIGKYIVSDDTIGKMVELLEKTKINQIEFGGIIYARPSDNNLILRNVCSGNDHVVRILEIPEYGYGDPVGDYHVHLDTELPSFLDLDPMEKGFDQMKFIGGVITNRIKCYMLKKMDIKLLNGLAELQKMFYDLAQKCNKENQYVLSKEFRDIHDSTMNNLIEEYFDVIEII